MADNDGKKGVFVEVPNLLRNKVKTTGKNLVNLDMLDKAEDVLAGMAQEYLEWANRDLIILQYAYEDLCEGDGDRKEYLDQVFSISHDMKGQGGTFGYDLVTLVGNYLCRLIENYDNTVSDKRLNDAVGIHVDALHLIISSNIRGDGGEQGKSILSGIEIIGKKLIKEDRRDL